MKYIFKLALVSLCVNTVNYKSIEAIGSASEVCGGAFLGIIGVTFAQYSEPYRSAAYFAKESEVSMAKRAHDKAREDSQELDSALAAQHQDKLFKIKQEVSTSLSTQDYLDQPTVDFWAIEATKRKDALRQAGAVFQREAVELQQISTPNQITSKGEKVVAVATGVINGGLAYSCIQAGAKLPRFVSRAACSLLSRGAVEAIRKLEFLQTPIIIGFTIGSCFGQVYSSNRKESPYKGLVRSLACGALGAVASSCLWLRNSSYC